MDKTEIEKRLVELKAAQAEVFKKKKADRDLDALQAVRDEMNDLKKQVSDLYRGRKKES